MSGNDYIAEAHRLAGESERAIPFTPAEILRIGAKTNEQRTALYNNADPWADGEALLALFGGKIPEILDSRDAGRLQLCVLAASKLKRYCCTFSGGGHVDSAHDLMVYGAMLEALTRLQRASEERPELFFGEK